MSTKRIRIDERQNEKYQNYSVETLFIETKGAIIFFFSIYEITRILIAVTFFIVI